MYIIRDSWFTISSCWLFLVPVCSFLRCWFVRRSSVVGCRSLVVGLLGFRCSRVRYSFARCSSVFVAGFFRYSSFVYSFFIFTVRFLSFICSFVHFFVVRPFVARRFAVRPVSRCSLFVSLNLFSVLYSLFVIRLQSTNSLKLSFLRALVKLPQTVHWTERPFLCTTWQWRHRMDCRELASPHSVRQRPW